jgi:hypothetical protein
MLTLPIKKKWFDLIRFKKKTTEYREVKPYWTSRFKNLKTPCYVALRNGYSTWNDTIEVLVKKIEVVSGNEQNYLDVNKQYYALRLADYKEGEG